MPFDFAENMLHATVRIEAVHNSTVIGTGTAFFYGLDEGDGWHIPILVTNKHVLDGASMIRSRTVVRDTENNVRPGVFANWSMPVSTRIDHPTEDLCALLFAEVMQACEDIGKPLFCPQLSKKLIPASDVWNAFSPVERVIMVGYPSGLYDQVNNLPILRHGATSTTMSRDYNGLPHFLVDMACFPGSSGSPVLQYEEGAFRDRKSGDLVLGTKTYLLGILFAGPTLLQTGEITFSQSPKVTFSSVMHLGIIIKATELLVLENLVRQALGPAPSGEGPGFFEQAGSAAGTGSPTAAEGTSETS